MISDPYGLIGILLILVAWLPETIKNLKATRVATRFEFLLLYTSGSLLLTIHAYILGDIIFIVLNALATALSGINIALKLLQSKNRKRV
ncbi:MAG: hypothetical protein DRZ80_07155 [Thermoprotei archaeon]|nr:MAG: hypothetical protein DRZ80_07155 [Thermoprotei archaeon]